MCCRRWNRWSPKGQAGARRAATPRKALPKYTESQGRSARATDLTCVSPLSPGQNRPQHAKNPLPRRERAGGRKEGDASVFAGEGRGLFPAEKSPLPSPGPPSLPQKPLTGRTGSWREPRGKKDWMTRQAEMEKMWPFRLQAVFPRIERAAWVAYAEGVVPPLLRRAPHSTGDQHGARGCRGCAGPDPLPLRRACPARMPGNGRHPTAIPQSASGSLPRQRPPKKRQRGWSSRRRPAPLQNRAQHGQPTLPSAAGVMTAKRRRTTGPRRRTWAWRTGCCPHGPGCRHGRAAGCWSPSHAPRA